MNSDNTVNDQITDSTSLLNTIMLGASAPESMGMLDITSAETFGMSMYNAVSAQQNTQISASAAVTSACAKMLATQPAIAPVTESPEVNTTPPFMPLGPEKVIDSSQMLSEANTLTQDALKMLNDKDSTKEKNMADITKLVATLQGYLADSKKDQAEPDKNIDTKPDDKSKEPDNKSTTNTNQGDNGKK
jgi:hypothetical protein